MRSVTNHPAIQLFVPGLREMNGVQLNAQMDNQKDSSIVARLSIPMVDYDSIRTERVSVNFSTVDANASLNANVGMVNTGSFRMQNASLESKIVNNDVKFDFHCPGFCQYRKTCGSKETSPSITTAIG